MASGLPNLVTPLPGPKARAVIERDAQFISPSYTRSYPLVAASGEGCIVEDVDGNQLSGLQRWHCRRRHGPLPSPGCRSHPAPGREADPHVGHRLLLREHGGPRAETGCLDPRRRAQTRLLRQLRHRSHRGRHQARPLPYRAQAVRGVLWSLPRAHHGLARAHRQPQRPAQELLPGDARRPPCAVRRLLPLPLRQDRRHLRGRVRASHRGPAFPYRPSARRSRRHRGRTGPG